MLFIGSRVPSWDRLYRRCSVSLQLPLLRQKRTAGNWLTTGDTCWFVVPFKIFFPARTGVSGDSGHRSKPTGLMFLFLLGSQSFWWHNMRSFKIFVCTTWFELWHFFCVIFLPLMPFRFWCHQTLIPVSRHTTFCSFKYEFCQDPRHLLAHLLTFSWDLPDCLCVTLALQEAYWKLLDVAGFFDIGIEESRAAVWQLFHSLTATTNYKWISRRIALRKLNGPSS